jgi:hypothetical protein
MSDEKQSNLVLDPFFGSGTTAVVADSLDANGWVVICLWNIVNGQLKELN